MRGGHRHTKSAAQNAACHRDLPASNLTPSCHGSSEALASAEQHWAKSSADEDADADAHQECVLLGVQGKAGDGCADAVSDDADCWPRSIGDMKRVANAFPP